MNKLAEEKSPYLLQHRHNPVHWYPWGEEAFAKARSEGKPIFLSIGYSTCYWCHVMEKDSFETGEVAEVLNAHFVSIKVDREERPDVDSIYMGAVVALTGHGGWPMSVFLTPELKPFFGGTFFPRQHFIPLLLRIDELWRSDRERIESTAGDIVTALKKEIPGSPEIPDYPSTSTQAVAELEKRFDPAHGGFSPAPKFPSPGAIAFLLRHHLRTGNTRALSMATFTLEAMARGGIYDHLAGGFARYSTDEKWLVPHFEKMLYDNAQLTYVYLEAFQLTHTRLFADVARETLEYVLRTMTAPEGGFYSAQDAGEVGKEGEYYVFTWDELATALSSEELDSLKEAFTVSERGNFENETNVLSYRGNWDDRTAPPLSGAMQKLLRLRETRQPPHLDDKVLTAWNGLMISAFAKGYEVLGDERYRNAAVRSGTFLRTALIRDGKLLRRYRDGDARHAGYIDDYAFTVRACLDLYQITFDESWIETAMSLQEVLDRDFWDEAEHGYFFAAAGDGSLIEREREFTDGAEPSGNAIALWNLVRLFHLTYDDRFKTRAEELLRAYASLFERYPSAFAWSLVGLDLLASPVKDVVLVGSTLGSAGAQLLRMLGTTFAPHAVVSFGPPATHEATDRRAPFRGKTADNGDPTIYVCVDRRCNLPTVDAEQAFQQIVSR